ncbi:MAG: lactate utilization protein [Lachnospiraceae bacterium]|nr:lactate utilization protein [Lachnospiraceae bacterium]
MTPVKTYYEKLAATAMKNLQLRQIEAHYCPTAKDAAELALSMVASGSTVSFGGSVTLTESGMIKALQSREDLTLLDRSKARSEEEVAEIYHKSLNADYYFMSSNAISVTGELVNTDGTGNRLAALIYGPSNVIILAGMNKVTPSVEAALTRVKNTASPINAIRLRRNTPCAASGVCSDCQSPECICAQTVITRRSNQANRIKVILIGEELGY